MKFYCRKVVESTEEMANFSDYLGDFILFLNMETGK